MTHAWGDQAARARHPDDLGIGPGEIATKRYTLPPASIPITHLNVVAEEIGRWAPVHVGLWGDRRVFKLDDHIGRFLRSRAAVALEYLFTANYLADVIVQTVQRNQFRNTYVKWILTRGSSGTPLMDPAGCEPNLIIMARPCIDRSSETGLRVKTVAVRRPPGQVLDAQIKSLNYLNLILAHIEAKGAPSRQTAGARPSRANLIVPDLTHERPVLQQEYRPLANR